MKRWLLYIMLVGVFGMHMTSCVIDDDPSSNCSQEENYSDKVLARVVVPGGETENLNVNTVRFLVFDPNGLCVDKTGAIAVTESNIEIQTALAGHHETQYVISVETDLEINKLMNGSKTYHVYAVVNETMGGDITGVESTNFVNSLNNVSTETELNTIMQQGRKFTFNAENDITGQNSEPAFIMCGMAELVYNAENATDPISVVIKEEGIDRSMAKVTIESISSGGVSTANVSRLFVTSVGFVNLPNYVYVEDGVVANDFLGLSTLDEKFRNAKTLSYDRNWDGEFKAGYTFNATLRQTMGGLYYQGDNNVATGGNESYTIFPPYAGNLNDSGKPKIDPGGGMIGSFKAGPASLLSGNKVDTYETTEVNLGNFINFIEQITGDAISGSTTPSIRDMTYDVTVTTIPDSWNLTLNASYYIPENLSESCTGLRIEMVIGTPYIEEPSAEEIEDMCKEQWQGGGDWNITGIQAWLDSYGGDKPPFTKTAYPELINNVQKYYYVNTAFAEAGWREQSVSGGVPEYFSGKEFVIGNQSKRLSFIVPIAVNKDTNGSITDNNVYRNHEYKISIIANEDAFTAINNYGVATAIVNSRALTAEDLGITVIYEVKPLK